VSCGARTFLPETNLAAVAQPTPEGIFYAEARENVGRGDSKNERESENVRERRIEGRSEV